MTAEICLARAGLYKSCQGFRRMCAFSLFKKKGILHVENCFSFNMRSMLTAKMFVIQTRNYILKCVNSLVLFTEMACDKNQTYLQVRRVRNWTHLEWLEVSWTHLASLRSGNFQPPSVRPIPDSPPYKYVCYRAGTRTKNDVRWFWWMNIYRQRSHF
jgi:hypothetical protein